MVNSRITVVGKLDREIKVNEDGTVDLIVTNELEGNARKDIREFGNSIFLIRLTKSQVDRNIENLKIDNLTIEVRGYVKSKVNKKGVPYIYISPEYIVFHEDIEDKQQFMREITSIKKQKSIVDTMRYSQLQSDWRIHVNIKELVEIDSADIKIVEEDHLCTKLTWLDLDTAKDIEKNFIVAVRPLQDGTYALVSGIGRFIVAKVLEKKLNCYITDLTTQAFEEIGRAHV